MTKQQMETIVGLIAGVELAITTFAHALRDRGLIADLEPIAAYFDKALAQIGTGVRNQKEISVALSHVASGLRREGLNPAEDLHRQLH